MSTHIRMLKPKLTGNGLNLGLNIQLMSLNIKELNLRILDESRDNSVDRAIVLLTLSEAQELFDSLKELLNDIAGQHAHVPSEDYKKEITLAIYNSDQLDGLTQRCQKLIRENL